MISNVKTFTKQNQGNKENIGALQKILLNKKLKKKSNRDIVMMNDKSKITKELEFIKNKMKEHFRFFDNHSP